MAQSRLLVRSGMCRDCTAPRIPTVTAAAGFANCAAPGKAGCRRRCSRRTWPAKICLSIMPARRSTSSMPRPGRRMPVCFSSPPSARRAYLRRGDVHTDPARLDRIAYARVRFFGGVPAMVVSENLEVRCHQSRLLRASPVAIIVEVGEALLLIAVTAASALTRSGRTHRESLARGLTSLGVDAERRYGVRELRAQAPEPRLASAAAQS